MKFPTSSLALATSALTPRHSPTAPALIAPGMYAAVSEGLETICAAPSPVFFQVSALAK